MTILPVGVTLEIVAKFTVTTPLDPNNLKAPIDAAGAHRGHIRVSPALYNEIRALATKFAEDDYRHLPPNPLRAVFGYPVVIDHDIPVGEIRIGVLRMNPPIGGSA